MRRRTFIAGLGSAAAILPHAAHAQRSDAMKLVAVLLGTAESDPDTRRRIAAFREGLKALGWIEGKNIRIEVRWGGGNLERIRAHGQALVEMKPDVILTNGTPSTAAISSQTTTVPVVFAVITDPISDGFVASLARPGGNITGFTAFDSEMGGKWVELLKEIAPDVKRVALLFNPRTAPGGGTGLMRPFFDAAARTLQTELTPVPVESAADIERALTAHAKQPNAGLIAMPDGFVVVNSMLVVRLANELRLPAVYPFRLFAVEGGPLSYGIDSADLNFRAASYVDRILKGANPADLPIQTPTKFEMVINLKTTKSLGLNVSLTLQSRADEVIE